MDNLTKGKLVIISAPSGSGKTTLVNYLMDKDLDLEFSVSVTTREPRNNEKNGKHYYFITADEFRKRIRKGDFVEWEEVYRDQYYGTPREEIERIFRKGKNVLFDVDVKGGINLKNIFGHKALSVFIQPPSVGELEKRLVLRGTDSPEKIRMRVDKALEEIKLACRFDYTVINDRLEQAQKEIHNIIKNFIERQDE
ncbi:MAG: guanylate kinase [Bacteroidales bacterium]|nr:guanylate kinase [Bacteroidales bacterium]